MFDISLEIKSPTVASLSGLSSKTGRPYSFHSQLAVLCPLDPASPLNGAEVRIPLAGIEPYPKGLYKLADDSIFVDRYNSLAFKPKLVPVEGSSGETAGAVVQAADDQISF